MEVGSGTGIMCMFAAQAGAKYVLFPSFTKTRVWNRVQCDLQQAKEIIKENHMEVRIVFHLHRRT